MKVVYVNRNTGEAFDAKEVTLDNLCDGMVKEQFCRDLSMLAVRMVAGDKGSITIKVIVEKSFDGDGAECLNIGTETSLDLPKIKMLDSKAKNINEQGIVLTKEERQNLFENIPLLPAEE